MPSSKLAGRSILIVEDEPLIAIQLRQAFEEAGAAVTTTSAYKQALILAERADLSAAVIDYRLSDGESTQICARLKGRGIPFVIYSGFSEVDGVCAEGPLVRKPAMPDVLIATVEGLLPA